MKSYINKIQLFREVDLLHRMLVQMLIFNLSKICQTSDHGCWNKNGPLFHSNISIEFIRWFHEFSLRKVNKNEGTSLCSMIASKVGDCKLTNWQFNQFSVLAIFNFCNMSIFNFVNLST